MEMEIARAYVLILIPIIIGLMIYCLRFIKVYNKKKMRNIFIIRSIVVVLAVAALSGITIQWSSKEITTIFLIDASDSTNEFQEEAIDFVTKSIQTMPKHNQAGVVAFGGDTQIEQFVSDKKLFTKLETTILKTSTNIEQAINTALSLMTSDTGKRIVLITDGYENAGQMNKLQVSLATQHVALGVYKLQGQQYDEVYVNNMTIPKKISAGDVFNIKIEVISNVETSAKLTLYSGRTVKGTEVVNLQKGKNNFVFTDTQTNTGLKNYKVIIEPNKDKLTVNNEYLAYAQIEAKNKILVVEGTSGESREFCKMLDVAGFHYDVVTSISTPTNITDMTQYKSIIMLNVHYDDLKKGFVKNIEDYVKEYGGGFVAIGGDNSYALGNYKNTVLEKILPVTMELKQDMEVPAMSMLLVIDHSGSMSEGNAYTNNLELAKEAGVEALYSLRPIDRIGVLSFDDTFAWTVKMRASDQIQAIEEAIYGIKLGGGTNILNALTEAVETQAKETSKIKHIILLTDGQDEYKEYSALIKKVKDNGITLSTVSIGEDVDEKTLSGLAEQCGGRYYHSDLSTNIPRIFAQEVYLSSKSYLINKKFTPVITSNSDIIREVSNNGFPSLYGYIAAMPKSTASVILESDEENPILSEWQYGLGHTIAWNSDGTGKWTKDFVRWNEYTGMWKNIINSTIIDVNHSDDVFNVSMNGNTAILEYTTKSYHENTNVSAVYTNEDGNTKKIELNPTAPGQFRANVKLDEEGVYSFNVREEENNNVVANYNSVAVMQYSPEYQIVDETDALDNFIKETNAKELNAKSNVFDQDVKSVASAQSLTNPFLILTIIFFMMDIIYRRLHVKFTLLEKALYKILTMFHFSKLKNRNLYQDKEIKKENDHNQSNYQQTQKENIDNEQTNGNKQDHVIIKKKEHEKKEKIAENKVEENKVQQGIDTATLLNKKKDRSRF